jgi:hypothetical protein
MFITKNNRLGFIHIPKTGGTSIEVAMRNLGPESKHTWKAVSVFSAHSSYNDWIQKTQQLEYYGRVPPLKWFTLVRHPMARMQSSYYYQIKHDKMRVSGEMPLKAWPKEHFEKRIEIYERMGINHVAQWSEEFVAEMTAIAPDNRYWWKHVNHRGIQKPQNLWIEDCPSIKIFKLENIDQCWQWLQKQGAPVEATHVKSSGSKPHWSKDFTQETQSKILDYYKQDFKKFGYAI